MIGTETGSVRVAREVLLVVRTATVLNRLMDVVPALADDSRVSLTWTVAPGSAFDDGLPELLDRLSARVIPWAEAVRREFDLALAASPNGELHQLRSPVLLLPHGAGFNKLLSGDGPDAPSPGASGLTAAQLLHEGRVIPARIAVGHREQIQRLGLLCPPAVERAAVVGDPCHDRLRASLPWREDYRAALGVRPGQSLVVLSSTWGRESLISHHPDLAARLLADLPTDEYRLALVLHPNVWTHHSEFNVRRWLDSALAAGLILVPPAEGWRAALVAADRFIGDHGSLSLYAASIGLPLLLAADGGPEIAPDSPMARLAGAATRLLPRRPLLAQLAAPAPSPELPAGAFSREGESLGLIAELIYRQLELTPPARRAVPLPVPLPRIDSAAVTELRVRTTLIEPAAADKPALLRVERFPAALTELAHEPADGAGESTREHLLCEPGPTAHRFARTAQILARRSDPASAGLWLDHTLATHPSCRIAAQVLDPTRCLVQLRDGQRYFTALTPGADPLLAVSALRHLTDLPAELRIELGGHRFEVTVTPADRP